MNTATRRSVTDGSFWTVPVYALYGEKQDDPALGLLHCESIALRSARHDWRIKPHRHDTLFQILYMRGGSGSAEIEDRLEDLAAGSLLILPALTVHGFRFSQDVDGHVVTFPDAVLSTLLQDMPEVRHALAAPAAIRLSRRAGEADVDEAIQRLSEEFAGRAPGRTAALRACLSLLLVAVGRVFHRPEGSRGGARPDKLRHVDAFRAAVERTFRAPRPVEVYASELGITATQLNRVCRQVLGKSALEVVHDRIVLEAKRELIYTTLTVNEIAYDLGFRDAAYFSRFFRKRTGTPPSRFRASRA